MNAKYRIICDSSEQAFVWGPDTQQTDIKGRLSPVVGLVFECFQQPGKTGLPEPGIANDLPVSGGVQFFYAADGKIIAFCHIERDGILCPGGGAVLEFRTGKRDLFSGCDGEQIYI